MFLEIAVDVAKEDTQTVGVTEEDGRNRAKWRPMIWCGNP